jgi:ubiquinone/menaquinone biosynthesis C-methylase UbiE
VNDVEFQATICDPAARTTRYRAMVAAYYDRVTDFYREQWGESFHLAIFSGHETREEATRATERMIAREGRFGPGMRVLDVGCGVGGPALTIAEGTGAHVTGVNIVPRQVEIARDRAAFHGLTDRTTFQLADAMHLPFAGGTFDAVYIFEAGCHMPDKAAFYRECARVLRPGGVFLGLEWMCRAGLTAAEEEQYCEPICRLHSVPHLTTLPEFERYLRAAGLGVEVLEDASLRGDILRNWEGFDEETIAALLALGDRRPPVHRMITDGMIALARGARAGAFLLGHWRARKPSPAVPAGTVTS